MLECVRERERERERENILHVGLSLCKSTQTFICLVPLIPYPLHNCFDNINAYKALSNEVRKRERERDRDTGRERERDRERKREIKRETHKLQPAGLTEPQRQHQEEEQGGEKERKRKREREEGKREGGWRKREGRLFLDL